MAPVDAHDELKHTINLVKHDAEDKFISFEMELKATEFIINADSSRLQQIFWNLVKNAVKFTPKYGKIRITTHNESSDLWVKVKDSGIGKIFNLKKIQLENSQSNNFYSLNFVDQIKLFDFRLP
jgi:signal transduction histidine kinase